MRKNFQMIHCTITKPAMICALMLAGLTGCSSLNSSFGSLMEPDRIDYKSAGKAPVSTLEIPPDLTQLQRDNRYAIPENNRGTATASGYSLQKSGVTDTTSRVIAPQSAGDARIERAGNQRWIVIRQTPEALWPQVKDFWQESGFLINVEQPDAGIMETDWAENRLKIPRDFVRNTLGKVLDSVYDTGERDKFRTRLERGADGSTEIYISHRGAQEVIVANDTRKESTLWTTRPSDPVLEGEFLARLMVRLGLDSERAKAIVANAPSQQPRAKLVKEGTTTYVVADEGFDRAWRRVGLALDRVGFTVEDRDRTQGLYYVRYVDQDQDAKNKSESGFIAKLFSFGSKDDKAKSAQRYRVSVKEAGAGSRISVLNGEGNAETSVTADKILTLLNEQLK